MLISDMEVKCQLGGILLSAASVGARKLHFELPDGPPLPLFGAAFVLASRTVSLFLDDYVNFLLQGFVLRLELVAVGLHLRAVVVQLFPVFGVDAVPKWVFVCYWYSILRPEHGIDIMYYT